MECPKCKKEMERLEWDKGQEDIGRDKLEIKFACHNCKIFVNEEYKLYKN